MNHFKIRAFFSQKNWPWLLSSIFILILLSLNNLLWKEHTINSETDILFKIRGGRKISQKILFINLAEEDIQKLGGWPITRDYYGYLTHILTEKGARVIGFDLLFDRRDQTYPEFDSMLARFIKVSGSVCLPLVFSNIIEIQEKINNRLPAKTGKGENPILPVKIFRKSAAALGFSNLGNQAVIRKIPLAVSSGDSVLFSWGVQLAHQYLNPAVPIEINSKQIILQDSDNRKILIPLDPRARVRLNYFGALNNITCMGFVNFLKIQEESPDSLNLRGKIVLIAPTSASLPVIKSTPLGELFPASLIHATLTENIIFQNYIREVPFWIDVLLIIVFIAIISLLCQIKNTRLCLTITTGVIVLYLLLAVGIFKYKNTALPIFHPFAAVLITSLYWIWQKKRRQNRNLSLRSDVLSTHLQEKQKQLLEAQ
ncbi:MAG: CHASE2 domain-containing protein, partial [bacterium]